jgi:Tfp pilus assembly protein PilV
MKDSKPTQYSKIATLSGNTLIEVLVASCILLFVSAISSLIYLNILKSNAIAIQFKAQQIIESDFNVIQGSTSSASLNEKIFEVGSIKIKRNLLPMPQFTKTVQVSYTAEFDQKEIYKTYYLYNLP